MLGRRRRRERRLRHRGRPATATILAAKRAGDGRWNLQLHVAPDGAPPFPATTVADLPPGVTPAVGSQIDVLHDPRGGRQVTVAATPAAPAAPPAAGAAAHHEPDAAPDPLAVIHHVLASLADGTGRTDGPTAGYTALPADPDAATAGAPQPDAADPADAVADILRRLAAGALSPRGALSAARALDLDAATRARILTALTRDGRLTPAQAAQLERHLGR